MPKITEQQRAYIKGQLEAAQSIAAKAQSENRSLTTAEMSQIQKHLADAKHSKAGADLLEQLGDLDQPQAFGPRRGYRAAALGTGWSDALGKAAGARSFGATLGYKALVGAGPLVVPPAFNSDIIELPDQPTFLRQIIPTQPTGTDGFSYVRETARTSNAAVVAKGGLKPTSSSTIDRIEDRCRTVAHLSNPIARQDLADAPALQDYVDGSLRRGLLVAEDAEILAADGTGEHVTGILETTGVMVQAWALDLFTTARKAVTKIETVAQVAPSYWVMNPEDWERFELTREDGTTGGFLTADQAPVDRAQRRLWGIPVLPLIGMPAGVALLGDFAGSCRVWSREEATVDFSEAVPDGSGHVGFQTNTVTARCESRIGFGVMRPAAFITVDLTA